MVSGTHLSDWLVRLTSRYLDEHETLRLKEGVNVAERFHKGFDRLDNKPYITHCLGVAEILAGWRAPLNVLLAGLLHDVHKPNYAKRVPEGVIEAKFGPEVAGLVHDVSRLGRMGPMSAAGRGESDSEEDVMAQLPWVAMILQKSPMAVVVKLADKLHNFPTIHCLDPVRQQEFATTTMRIFVPFAERLGMRLVKRKLQDLAFLTLHPEQYEELNGRYPLTSQNDNLSQLLTQIETHLSGKGMLINTNSRPKSIYDLFRQESARAKRPLPWSAIQTVVVETENEDACYQALGYIHQLFQPQFSQFQDYISAPKPNGYRGLHTRVRLQDDTLQLIAIRTRSMNLVANNGLTAQWQQVPGQLLPQFGEWHAPPEGKVTVVTPEGDLIQLPKGSTPIDFAYAVHWALGNQCTGVLVNGRNVAFGHILETGDVVQILTGTTNIGPSAEWLDIVKTKRARTAIRRWLKRENPSDAADLGWTLVDANLKERDHHIPFSQAAEPLTAVAHRMGYDSRQNLLIAVGIRQREVAEVVDQLIPLLDPINRQPALKATVASLVQADLPQRLGRCCNPIPPDPIVAYVTKGRLVTVHRVDCPRIRHLRPLVNADWNTVNMRYRSIIELQCIDRPGLVADVSQVMSQSETNMTSFHAGRMQDGTAYIRIGLGDVARSQQSELQKRLKEVKDVERVYIRVTKGEETAQPQAVPVGNPYTLRPVRGKAFYGRRAELRQLLENLRSTGPGEAVLLWGPRRIGKTSLLLEFQQTVMNSDDYVLAFVDMQRLSGRSTTFFLRDILKSIIQSLDLPNTQPPKINRMRRDPLSYFRGFLENKPILQQKHLVLIIDEFQLLTELTEPEIPLADITRYFRSLIQHRGGISVIFSGGGILDHLLAQPDTSFMLEVVRHQKMEFLRSSEARQLIVEPAQQVEFSEQVVTALLQLSAGHPYYLQWLCGELVSHVTREERTFIEQSDLEKLLMDWLPQQGEQFFNHLWGNATGFEHGHQQNQLWALTGIAEATQATETVSIQAIIDRFQSILTPDEVHQAVLNLHKIDTLRKQNNAYQIRIPLCQKWLLANYSLAYLIRTQSQPDPPINGENNE